MVNIKSISLSEEANEVWKKKFKGGQDFSNWIQNRLLEEENKEDTPEYLRKKILELTADIEKLTAQRALYQKRLSLKLEEEHIKSEALLNEQQRLAELNGKKVSPLLIYKISREIDDNYKKHKDIDSLNKLYQQIAEKYITITGDKPELNLFIKEELNNG
jgi:hypothetical protein